MCHLCPSFDQLLLAESYSRSPRLLLPKIVFPDGVRAPRCVHAPPSPAAELWMLG